jgi:2-keto-4-pentenoate hydratase
MSSTGIEMVARALVTARRNHRAADAALLNDALDSAAQAYAVQDLVAREMGWLPQGVPPFWKSGGPSRDALLTHAALPDQGVQPSPADMRDRPFCLRLVEAEIALRLARDVNAPEAAALTHDSAAPLVDAMAVSIEVVDSRWQQAAQAPALLKLADLQSHGALALGAWRPFAARDWSTQACSVQIGGRPIAQFKGTHALGDPAWLLPIWLRHATRNGEEVQAGTVVTTGTWCGMLPAAAGELVIVHFEGVGEASVQL